MSVVENILHYQKRYRVASHLVFWLTVYLIGISNSKYHDGKEFTYGFAFAGNALFFIPQVMSAYFLSYAVLPAFIYRKKYVVSGLLFLTGSYVICVIARFLIVRVAEPLAGVAPKAFETNKEIITDLPKLVYVYFFPLFSIAFVFLFIKLLIQQVDVQKRALTLEKEKAETELKLLKSQLNPHFLFNTLNNIYALSLLQSPVISSSIGKLAEILDHILYKCERPLVPLSGEVALLYNYLALEKLRYDERLQVRLTVEVEEETMVPPLILLSLVENAFKHGASKDIGYPVIDIGLHVTRESLRYCVANSFLPEPAREAGGKIGLSNLKKQLEILYPERHLLTTGCEEGLFKVLLVLDLKKTA
jgi:hypothetical protein